MRKVVYVAMSADVVHAGHINIIEEAAKYGDVTIGLLTDEAIAAYKRMPLLDYSSREHIFRNIKGVVAVVPQDSVSHKENLEKLRPDFVVHGDDWKTGFLSSTREEVIEILSRWNGQLIEVPYTKGLSSSELEKNLRSFYGSPDARRGSLRKMLSIKPFVRVIEASNGLSGLIVENAKIENPKNGAVKSFDAMWVSSLCDSTFKGKPDIELVDFTSRINTISEIMDVTTKPIILDGDTGGRIEHFVHNVRTLERIGVSMVIIEDKTGLKQNSLFGTEVEQVLEDPHAFAQKIQMGKQAQRTKEFMICARIEALIAGFDVDEALKRAQIYIEEGGVDAIMIHSKESDGKEIFAFLERFKERYPNIPVVLVPTSYNTFTEEELAEKGASIIIHANHLLRAAYPAMVKVAETILEDSRSKEADELCTPIKDVLRLIPMQ